MIQLLAIIAVNLTGLALRYFDLDRYIIAAGFRFHLTALLPFLFLLLSSELRGRIKANLTEASFKNKLAAVSFIIVPAAVATASLLLFKYAEAGDPEYFYELGLSSIVDFPVYLFWNMPQLLMLSLSVIIFNEGRKYRFPMYALTLMLYAVYEFIPLKASVFVITDAAAAAALIIISAAFLAAVRNVYYFGISIFAILWSNTLLFGSASSMLVRLFLAGNYDQWEGFFKLQKAAAPYQLLLHLGVIIVLFIIPFLIYAFKKDSISISNLQAENVHD